MHLSVANIVATTLVSTRLDFWNYIFVYNIVVYASVSNKLSNKGIFFSLSATTEFSTLVHCQILDNFQDTFVNETHIYISKCEISYIDIIYILLT